VILPDQAIEIVGIEKKVMVGRVVRSAYWLNHDPSGLTEAGYGPATSHDERAMHEGPSGPQSRTRVSKVAGVVPNCVMQLPNGSRLKSSFVPPCLPSRSAAPPGCWSSGRGHLAEPLGVANGPSLGPYPALTP
jgi:hypothetical protein